MKIAVDIDDTLNILEREKYAAEYVAKKGLPYRLTGKVTNRFLEVCDWDIEEVLRFMREGGIAAFEEARVRRGAKKALAAWQCAGHEVIILTSRMPSWFGDPYRVSEAWLTRHAIPYTSLVVDIQDKATYCAENAISVLIDDNTETCLAAQRAGIAAVLAVGKHNRSCRRQIAYGGATWQSLEREVERICAKDCAEACIAE